MLVTGGVQNKCILSHWLADARACGQRVHILLHSSEPLSAADAAWCAAEAVVVLPPGPTAWGHPSIVVVTRRLFQAAAAAAAAAGAGAGAAAEGATHALLLSGQCVPVVPARQLAAVCASLAPLRASRFKLGAGQDGVPAALRTAFPGGAAGGGACKAAQQCLVHLASFLRVDAPKVWDPHWAAFLPHCPPPAAGAPCCVLRGMAMDELFLVSLLSIMRCAIDAGPVCAARFTDASRDRAALCDLAFCTGEGAASLAGVLRSAAWRLVLPGGARRRAPCSGHLTARKLACDASPAVAAAVRAALTRFGVLSSSASAAAAARPPPAA